MKKSLILATSFAMALGVGVAVGAHHAREVEVKADTETTVYYAVTTEYSVKCNVHMGSNNQDRWAAFDMSKNGEKFNGIDVYSCTYTDDYNGVATMQFQQYDGEEWKSEVVPISSWTAVSTYNGKIWDGTGSWKIYIPDGGTSYKVDVYVDGVKRGSEDINENSLPVEPDGEYGKYFSGWFDNAECSEGHEVTGVTSTAPVYCKHLSYPTTSYTYSLEKAEEGKFAEVYLYEFDSNGNKAAWPGTKLETTSFSVPTSATVILNAGDGKEQTVNISQPDRKFDGDVLRVLSSSDGEGHYYGQWATEHPAENGYYLYGSKTNWTYLNAPKLGAGDDLNEAILENYTLTVGETFKVRKYQDGVQTWFSINGLDGDEGNYVAEEAKAVNVCASKDSKLYVVDYVPPEPADEPENDGYYLASSKSDLKFAGATPMSTEGTVGNVAELFNYSAAKDEVIKVRGFFDGEDPEKKEGVYGGSAIEGVGAAGEDGTFVMSAANLIDVFAKWEESTLKYYITKHADRYNVTFNGYFYEGKNLEKPMEVVDTQRATEGVVFNVDEGALAKAGYELRGVYTDDTFEHEYVAAELEESTVLYVKYTKLGYYLTGDDTFLGTGHGWNVDYSAKIVEYQTSNRFEGTITVPEGVDAEHPMLVKPLEYKLIEGEDPHYGWGAAYYEMGINPDTSEKWVYSFASVDESGNFKFVESGTFAFYVYDTNKVTFNSGEYVFHSAFLTQVGGECKNDGSTDTAALKVIWGNMKTAFNALDSADQKKIKDIGFDGGDEESGDDRLRMIAKYNYIVTKYGTDEFEDFIWEKTRAPRVGNNVMFLNNSNNTGLIIIISVSAISVISIAAFLMLMKRKEK